MKIACPHPNCGKSVAVGPEGPPKRCPHCGLLLKRSAEARDPRGGKGPAQPAPTPPTSTVSSTRENRSAGALNPSRATEPAITASATARPSRSPAPPANAADDDPFGINRRTSDPSDLPFAPPETDDDAPRAGGELWSGGGSSAASAADRALGRSQKSSLPMLLGGVVLIGGLAGGGYAFRDTLFGKAKPAPTTGTTTFADEQYNYIFEPPSNQWKRDEKLESEERLNLAFRRDDVDAFITLRAVEIPSTSPSAGQLADETAREWSTQLTDFKLDPNEDIEMGGRPGVRLRGEGTTIGKLFRREGYVTFHQGIAYRLTLTAPAESIASFRADFESAVAAFKFRGDRPGWKDAKTTALKSYASSKHPYRVKAVMGAWIEAPDLTTNNLYADLKLVDRQTKDANIVIAPRKTPSVEAFVEAYIERQRKELSDVTIKESEKNLKIGGLAAQQLTLTATDATGEFFFLTSFVQNAGLVYQIECRAPLNRRDKFESVFREVTDTFEITPDIQGVVAKPADPPKKAATEPAVAEIKPAKVEARPAPKADEVSMADANAKPDAESSSKPAEAKTAKAAEAKPASTKKRKSLDDLDSDAPPAKSASGYGKDSAAKSAADKPAGEMKETADDAAKKPGTEPAKKSEPSKDSAGDAKKPEEKKDAKKRKSLDDLD